MRLAIVTGGTRGIGRGISSVLAESKDYEGLLLSYNTNLEAAETHRQDLLDQNDHLVKVALVGGDLTTTEARNDIFECVDTDFCDYVVATVVHNAGQYVGVTSENASGIKASGVQKFGSGTLLKEEKEGSKKILDTTQIDYYQKLYGTAFIDLCERSLVRMKRAYEQAKEQGETTPYRGSIIGISSPGCNANFNVSTGSDMPGSGKCIMEYTVRLYAAEVAKYRINANIIIPGFTRSDAWGKVAEMRGSTKEAFLEYLKQKNPMQQIIDPTDIGDTVQFLAGSGGGRFITGMSLRVDAGLHLKG